MVPTGTISELRVGMSECSDWGCHLPPLGCWLGKLHQCPALLYAGFTGTPCPVSLGLVKVLAGFPQTGTALGQSQGLLGLALWAMGRCHQSRLPLCRMSVAINAS